MMKSVLTIWVEDSQLGTRVDMLANCSKVRMQLMEMVE